MLEPSAFGTVARLRREGASEEDRFPPGFAPFAPCAQCNNLAAPLTFGEGLPPAGVHLHKECTSRWLAHNHVTRERFRVVGATTPGTYCACCHSPEGDVARIKDSHEVGGKAEALHQACAERFFCAPVPEPGAEEEEEEVVVTTASVAFLITNVMKGDLRSLGYSENDIAHMTPAQAHAILESKR